MEKTTPTLAPSQGKIRLTPKQRQLLLSTRYARRALGLFRQMRAEGQRLSRLKLRRMRKQKLAEIPKSYPSWLSEKTVEESVIRVQLAMLSRRLNAKGK